MTARIHTSHHGTLACIHPRVSVRTTHPSNYLYDCTSGPRASVRFRAAGGNHGTARAPSRRLQTTRTRPRTSNSAEKS